MKKNYKNGFTLVELSIVLVAVGLIIGGILIGISLIGSAKINGYVQKLQQYEIANESIRLAEKSFQLGESDLVSLLRVKALTYEAERAFTTRKIQVQWDIARYNQAVGVLP